MAKSGKSGEKLEKVAKSYNKWGKLGKRGEKWQQFGKIGYFFAKWPPAAILDDQKSLLIVFLAISDQYATFFFGFFFKMAAHCSTLLLGKIWETVSARHAHIACRRQHGPPNPLCTKWPPQSHGCHIMRRPTNTVRRTTCCIASAGNGSRPKATHMTSEDVLLSEVTNCCNT